MMSTDRILRRFPKGATAVIAWAALYGVAWGAPQEVASGVVLDTLVAEALRANPQVRSIRAQWEASREGPAQQRALPNPTLAYSGMDRVNGGNWPNTEEKRFMLEQEFPWFGKRGLRGELAAKEAETRQSEYGVTERDLIQMVKESYFELYGSSALSRSSVPRRRCWNGWKASQQPSTPPVKSRNRMRSRPRRRSPCSAEGSTIWSSRK